MGLPLGDWQFWVATAITLVALRYVLKLIMPRGLPFTKTRRRAGERRATLTVDRKPVDKP